MGHSYKYICPQCQYSCRDNSGRGFFSEVEAYVCKDCKIVSNLLIGTFPRNRLNWVKKPERSKAQEIKSLFIKDLDYEKKLKDYLEYINQPEYINIPKAEICCKDCKGHNIVPWDKYLPGVPRTCPKCNISMECTGYPDLIMWD